MAFLYRFLGLLGGGSNHPDAFEPVSFDSRENRLKICSANEFACSIQLTADMNKMQAVQYYCLRQMS